MSAENETTITVSTIRYACSDPQSPLVHLELALTVYHLLLIYATASIWNYPLEAGLGCDICLEIGIVFLTMAMFNLMWWYARHSDLIDKSLDLQLREGMARSYLLGTLVYLLAVVLSLINIVAALILYMLIPSLYILTPPFEHHLARKLP